MNRRLVIAAGAVVTVALVVAGLWGWYHADVVVARAGWQNRAIGAWAVRCMAVALVAIGQAASLGLVVERVYAHRRDAVCTTARLSAVLVFVACTAAAIALGLAGR